MSSNNGVWTESNEVDDEDEELMEVCSEFQLAATCLAQQIDSITSCLRRSKKNIVDFAELAESFNVRRKRI